MKKSVIFLIALCTAFSAIAQEKAKVTIGNGAITKSTRNVGSYEKINVSGPFDIRMVSGQQGSVSVEADNNIIDFVVTEVKGGVLNIAPEKGKLFKSSRGNKVIIKVPVNTISEVALLGSGNVNSRTTFKNDIKVTLDGSGTIDLMVECANAEVVILGSGDIKIKGKTQNLKCLVVGSGAIKATEFEAQDTEVTVSGSGSADIYTNHALTGRITGSGSVAFSGNPKEKDLKRTGSGGFRIIE